MAGGVLGAAWIQATPVWVAAGAAIYGLSTWRRQLSGQRRLRHAEKALAAGGEAFAVIRAVRSRLIDIPRENAGDPVASRAARIKIIDARLKRAWTAWRRFQKHYILSSLFSQPDASRTSVAKEVWACLFDLQDHAESVFTDWGDFPDAVSRDEWMRSRNGFFGVTTPPGGVDPIEQRLQKAEAALEAELRPVLTPGPGWCRFRIGERRGSKSG